jgi:hypothetical protein
MFPFMHIIVTVIKTDGAGKMIRNTKAITILKTLDPMVLLTLVLSPELKQQFYAIVLSYLIVGFYKSFTAQWSKEWMVL